MPLKLAGRIQAGLPIANFANFAKLLREFVFEERVGNSLVTREPVGVVPRSRRGTNPLHQIALKVAPALAAGCTVVLKPSEVAPFNAFILAKRSKPRACRKRVQPGDRLRRERGRGARQAPRHRHDFVHRLDARRQADFGASGPDGQARGPRAGRQERPR